MKTNGSLRVIQLALLATCLSAINPPPSYASIDPAVHKLCSEAKDYLGCVKASTAARETDLTAYKVNKFGYRVYETNRGSLTFDPGSIKAAMVRNKYGRYIKFFVEVKRYQEATQGRILPAYTNPATITTNIVGNTITTTTAGGETVGGSYIPGTPGGFAFKGFEVLADCKDYTFDAGNDSHGWYNIKAERRDSAAGAIGEILDEYCPQIGKIIKD